MFTGSGDKEELKFGLWVVPDPVNPPSGSSKTGKMLLTLPGSPEDTEAMAYLIVSRAKDRMCFPNGQIEISWGLQLATRIPETDQEKSEIGENTHWARLSFVEAPTQTSYDPSRLNGPMPTDDAHILLGQFNAAKELKKPVEQYLALFKILERAYAHGPKGKLLQVLSQSDSLYSLVQTLIEPTSEENRLINRKEYSAFLKELIRVRGNCAHLRGRSGYAPGDPKIHTEVAPLVPIVRMLAEMTVKQQLGGASPGP